MQMVKIQIPDRDECAQAFATLIRRGRVDCYPDNTFIIPEAAIEVLQGMGVSNIELGRGGLDFAQAALRDSSVVSPRSPEEAPHAMFPVAGRPRAGAVGGPGKRGR